MKNSTFYLIIVALIFTSCKEGQNEADKEKQPVKEIVEKVVQKKKLDTACFSSHNIYPATAWMWSEGYVSYQKQKSRIPGAIIPTDTITSPVLLFATANLTTLKSQIDISAGVRGNEGVLLYYIMADTTDTAPSLAMVNTVNCRLVNTIETKCTDCVLVSWSKGNGNHPKQELVSSGMLAKYKLNWQKYMDNIQVHEPGFTEVNGYNYSWKTLETVSFGEKEIAIKYGLRTLEPSDATSFKVKDTTKTGSVILSNVLVGGSKIPLTFEKLLAINELDFALPCPEFCGKE